MVDKIAVDCWLMNIIAEHKKTLRNNLSEEELRLFLKQQYHQLNILNRVIAGDLVFVGAPPIGEGYKI